MSELVGEVVKTARYHNSRILHCLDCTTAITTEDPCKGYRDALAAIEAEIATLEIARDLVGIALDECENQHQEVQVNNIEPLPDPPHFQIT